MSAPVLPLRAGIAYEIDRVAIEDATGAVIASAHGFQKGQARAAFLIDKCNMAEELTTVLMEAYGVLADIHHDWPGRITPAGQHLLTTMRETISAATGLSARFVQDNARSLLVREALAKGKS